MEIIIIILSILLILSVIININMFYKITSFEKIITNSNDIEDKMYNIIKEVTIKIIDAYSIIKRADNKGIFESDDHVGITFNIIKNAISELSEKLQESVDGKKE